MSNRETTFKIVLNKELFLYLKATRLAIDDMAMSYSHQLVVLLTMLSRITLAKVSLSFLGC